MLKLNLKKTEEPEIKLPTSFGSQKKQDNSRKNICLCFIDYTKAFDCLAHKKLEYSSRDGNLTASWEICMQLKKQQLEPDMDQWMVPNWKSNTSRLYIVTMFVQLISKLHHVKCRAGWNTSWNKGCQEKFPLISDTQMTPPLWQKTKRN